MSEEGSELLSIAGSEEREKAGRQGGEGREEGGALAKGGRGLSQGLHVVSRNLKRQENGFLLEAPESTAVLTFAQKDPGQNSDLEII